MNIWHCWQAGAIRLPHHSCWEALKGIFRNVHSPSLLLSSYPFAWGRVTLCLEDTLATCTFLCPDLNIVLHVLSYHHCSRRRGMSISSWAGWASPHWQLPFDFNTILRIRHFIPCVIYYFFYCTSLHFGLSNLQNEFFPHTKNSKRCSVIYLATVPVRLTRHRKYSSCILMQSIQQRQCYK